MRAQAGVRSAAPALWHVTALFVGEVPEAAVPALADAAEPLQAREHFTLRFDRLGGFPRSSSARVLVALAQPSRAFDDVCAALAAQARERGYEVRAQRGPAHVTLGRARAPVTAPTLALSAELRCEQLVLWRSETQRGGPRYVPLRSFPLH